MFKLITKYKKTSIAIAVVVIIFFIFSLSPSVIPTPQIETFNPPSNSTKFSVIGKFEIDLDIPIISSDLSITSIPEANWDIKQLEEKSVIVSPQKPLTRVTDYNLSIYWKNQPISTYKLTTEDTQTDYEVIKNVKDEIAKNYPLATKIPYETSFYRVIYSGPLTLEITIKDPDISSAEAINEIKSWVTKNGGSTTAHSYTISSVTPTPKPSGTPLVEEPIQ